MLLTSVLTWKEKKEIISKKKKLREYRKQIIFRVNVGISLLFNWPLATFQFLHLKNNKKNQPQNSFVFILRLQIIYNLSLKIVWLHATMKLYYCNLTTIVSLLYWVAQNVILSHFTCESRTVRTRMFSSTLSVNEILLVF